MGMCRLYSGLKLYTDHFLPGKNTKETSADNSTCKHILNSSPSSKIQVKFHFTFSLVNVIYTVMEPSYMYDGLACRRSNNAQRYKLLFKR